MADETEQQEQVSEPQPVEEPAVAASEQDAVDADLAELREQAGRAEEYLGLAQRAQADFDNYRRRMTREIAAAEARGLGKLAKELLPALDNLDRALATVADDAEDQLSHGVRLLRTEIAGALSRVGIEGYDPKGEPFDPNLHEAMVQQPVEGAETGTIVEVYQPGYRLNETVLRPARVVVAA